MMSTQPQSGRNTLSPSPGEQKIISLQVGERRFTTTAQTLTRESPFFSSLLSGHREGKQADGSYFIDADPDLFAHILRYLRRGVLPVFYDRVKGYDEVLCLAILEEARYFQIERLVKWFEEKTYLQAVSIHYEAKAVKFDALKDFPSSKSHSWVVTDGEEHEYWFAITENCQLESRIGKRIVFNKGICTEGC